MVCLRSTRPLLKQFHRLYSNQTIGGRKAGLQDEINLRASPHFCAMLARHRKSEGHALRSSGRNDCYDRSKCSSVFTLLFKCSVYPTLQYTSTHTKYSRADIAMLKVEVEEMIFLADLVDLAYGHPIQNR